MSNAPHRLRNLGVGLVLLSLSACGLSDYENLMRQTQEREERFREEQKYLDNPVKVPMRKDKEDKDVQAADLFLRPPKGIQATGQAVPGSGILWSFPRRPPSDFTQLDLAIAEEESKDFANDVLRNYQAAGSVQQRVRQLNVAGREAMIYDTWEFDSNRDGYSVNILRGSKPQTAVIFVYPKGRREELSRPIELSLESLSFGRQASKARQKFSQTSPWQLKGLRPS